MHTPSDKTCLAGIDRLLTLREVLTQTGMSRATLYRRIEEGRFPPPVKNGRTSRWPASEVGDFIEACKAARKLRSSTSDECCGSSSCNCLGHGSVCRRAKQ